MIAARPAASKWEELAQPLENCGTTATPAALAGLAKRAVRPAISGARLRLTRVLCANQPPRKWAKLLLLLPRYAPLAPLPPD